MTSLIPGGALVTSSTSVLAVARPHPHPPPYPSHHHAPAPVSSFSAGYFGEHFDDTDTVADARAIQSSSRVPLRRSGPELSGRSFDLLLAALNEDEQATG